MRRVLLIVQYDGTDYHGFQRQPNVPSVQEELEGALSRLLEHQVSVTGAGRTDAGVHALGQTVTFETDSTIPTRRIVLALNALLPGTVSAVGAQEVPADFHPRYDATGKLYGYRILNRELPSPFICRYAWHVRRPLDVSLMRDAAARLIGEHDFAAFSSAGMSVSTTVRTLRRLDVNVEGDLLELRAEADGFLYMMVRRIVGALVEVGRGRLSVEEVGRILEGRDRTRAAFVAPPQGLSLIRVMYGGEQSRP
ncbi:MAG: tRNA pseudouridine(38-40) synthase TruA [Armatimonadota bacterium]